MSGGVDNIKSACTAAGVPPAQMDACVAEVKEKTLKIQKGVTSTEAPYGCSDTPDTCDTKLKNTLINTTSLHPDISAFFASSAKAYLAVHPQQPSLTEAFLERNKDRNKVCSDPRYAQFKKEDAPVTAIAAAGMSGYYFTCVDSYLNTFSHIKTDGSYESLLFGNGGLVGYSLNRRDCASVELDGVFGSCKIEANAKAFMTIMEQFLKDPSQFSLPQYK